MKALFVGGVWDGQRKEVAEGREYVTAARLTGPLIPVVADFCLEETLTMTYDEYRIFDLYGKEMRHALYVLIDLDADSVIELLLRYYREIE